MKKLIIVLTLLLVGAFFQGCTKKNPVDDGTVLVRVGLVGENNDQWEYLARQLADEGIKIELIKFADYSQPNQALADKELEMNAFQHYAYLNNEKAIRKFDLSVIGDSIIAPLALYSRKVNSVGDLKANDKIAIPNDPTNGGRALKLLESAGLITVRPEAGFLPVVGDITSNPLNLEIIEVEAAQTPRLLQDVAASVINGAHAVDAGFTPSRDALIIEQVSEGSENPYINIIVVRTEDLDNPTYRRIVEAYHTDEVEEIIEKAFRGAYLPAWK